MPHEIGYLVGVVIYATLFLMVWQGTGAPSNTRLPLITAVLGLLWNAGQLVSLMLAYVGLGEPSLPAGLVGAVAFSALDFLPAVVVHSALADPLREGGRRKQIAIAMLAAAYGVCGVIGLAQFQVAFARGWVPNPNAQHMLTPAFGTLIVPLVLLTRSEAGWRRTLWVLVLALFAVWGRALSYHAFSGSLLRELVGHHASLLFAFAVLYQDYRYALADLFLKQVLSLFAVVGLVFWIHAVLTEPWLGSTGPFLDDSRGMGMVLGLAAAVLYPAIRRSVGWIVDRMVIRREGHRHVRREIARVVAEAPTVPALLDAIAGRLKQALGAADVHWSDTADIGAAGDERASGTLAGLDTHTPGIRGRIAQALSDSRVSACGSDVWPLAGRTGALVLIVTAEHPWHYLVISGGPGGRRLSADDLALVSAIAQLAARRIDELRIVHERFERELREQRIAKLATEAELKALRAQLDPHFLFNAMNTIGHLIRGAPDRALEMLLDLTDLLRRVLRSEGRFTTLGRELEVIACYLDIERARFEERLDVRIDVPEELRQVSVPPLLVLPLVENAIKHGIAQCLAGGTVSVTVRAEPANGDDWSSMLHISVSDTGPDETAAAVVDDWRLGVGLRNLEQRLQGYYRGHASLSRRSGPGVGTTIVVSLPMMSASAADEEPATSAVGEYR